MSHGGPDEGRLIADRYRLLSIVGRGGMGTVWQARDEVLDRDVAVKEVTVARALGDAERELLHQRTLREARATARLNHPNIVTVHDVVNEADRPWIVMEFVRARSFQDIVDDEGPQPPQRVAEVGRQTLAALRAAHGIGILHRDVKPSNVLITDDDDRVVLTDFGIAHVEGDTNLTQTGLIVGSPAYIAPERAQGNQAVAASDLWALGATLYTACEGRPPYQRTDAMSVLAAILTEEPPPPQNTGPLTPVVHGLMHRDPAQRMTAEAAAEQLAQIAAGAPVPSTVPTAPPAYPPPPPVTPPQVAPQHGVLQYGAPQYGAPQHRATAPIPPEPPLIPFSNGQPTGPVQPPGRKGITTALFIAVGVLTAAVVVLAAFLVLRPKDNNPPGPGGTTPPVQQGGQPTAPSSSPPAQQTAAPELPAGWTSGSGPGYTIGVPAGWQRSVEGRSVFWRDSGSAAYVQVDRTEWTGAPYEAWQQWESEVIANDNLENYTRVDLRSVDGTSYEAADIEFTWDGKSGQRMHGVDRRIIADGRRYAVFVAIPVTQWDTSQERVNTFLNTFRPS